MTLTNNEKNGFHWDGSTERRKIEGGRRSADFCTEHCLLKKIYTKEFESIGEHIKDINRRKEKQEDDIERLFEKLESKHDSDRKDADQRIDAKVSTKIFLWLIGILITYLIGSTLVLWIKLSSIETAVAVIKIKQETILRRHDLEESRRQNEIIRSKKETYGIENK